MKINANWINGRPLQRYYVLKSGIFQRHAEERWRYIIVCERLNYSGVLAGGSANRLMDFRRRLVVVDTDKYPPTCPFFTPSTRRITAILWTRPVACVCVVWQVMTEKLARPLFGVKLLAKREKYP
ncbi:hypothetical protein OHJ28_13225 [Dickeya fangzhongdai]|uniref:hypothetical protein n=1 Tax=Dickeya fangzhongdai TaxID=1778540 RepID=UPI00330736D2